MPPKGRKKAVKRAAATAKKYVEYVPLTIPPLNRPTTNVSAGHIATIIDKTFGEHADIAQLPSLSTAAAAAAVTPPPERKVQLDNGEMISCLGLFYAARLFAIQGTNIWLRQEINRTHPDLSEPGAKRLYYKVCLHMFRAARKRFKAAHSNPRVRLPRGLTAQFPSWEFMDQHAYAVLRVPDNVEEPHVMFDLIHVPPNTKAGWEILALYSRAHSAHVLITDDPGNLLDFPAYMNELLNEGDLRSAAYRKAVEDTNSGVHLVIFHVLRPVVDDTLKGAALLKALHDAVTSSMYKLIALGLPTMNCTVKLFVVTPLFKRLSLGEKKKHFPEWIAAAYERVRVEREAAEREAAEQESQEVVEAVPAATAVAVAGVAASVPPAIPVVASAPAASAPTVSAPAADSDVESDEERTVTDSSSSSEED